MTTPKVLFTGAGGPAAVAGMRALHGRAEVHAVDIDPFAVGLYLVGADRRALVPRGDDPRFVDAVHDLVGRWSIDVLVPTVDSELIPCADADSRFAEHGCSVMVPSSASLRRTVDKWHLVQTLAGHEAVPETMLLDGPFDEARWTLTGAGWPAMTKPRLGSGGRGVAEVAGPDMARGLPTDGSHLLQALLPGDELSVDVLARRAGGVVAAVPRLRLKVDSGIAVAGETRHDESAIRLACEIVDRVGLVGPLNVQFKRDRDGAWKLLEINPRLPGSSPLTMAAGVDFVGLALDDLLGAHLDDWYDFADIAMVRHWEDVVVPSGEFARTADGTAARSARSPSHIDPGAPT